MGFKYFYLRESSSKDYKKLKNIISGAADKEVTTEEKRPNGKYFIIPSVGSWTSFAGVLKQELSDMKWDDKSPKSTELKFENSPMTLFIKMEKSNIQCYLTDKPKQEPEWEDVEINTPKEEKE
jgi:hypothetical protein